MLNKKIMILTIFIVSLFAISAISAADNATDDVVNMEETDAVSVDEADEVVGVEDNQVILGNESDDVGNFTELSDLIYNTPEGTTLNLTKDYKYVDGFDSYIQIYKPIIIEGNNYVVDGNLQSKIFDISSNGVTLRNLRIENGQNWIGGSICSSGQNLNIINCTFKNDKSTDGKSGGDGGAIYISGKNSTVINCTFTNCSAECGGAILWSADYGNLINSDFYECFTFRNKAGAEKQGGAVRWEGNNGKIIDCNFNNNFGIGSALFSGGAIYLRDSDLISVENCTFINNTANVGAAICMYYCDNIIIDGCEFIKNIGGTGSISSDWCDSNSILNCYFENNIDYDGESGAISGYCWTNGLINNCTFINNGQNDTIEFGEGSGIINNSYFSPGRGSIVRTSPDINIIKRKSYLNLNNISFNYQTPVLSSLFLNLEDNKDSTNETVNLIIDTGISYVTFNILTDEYGRGTTFEGLFNLDVGVWDVTAVFEGNDNYCPCNATGTITVLPPSTSLTIDDVNTTWNQETNFTAKVMSDNKTVDEGTVSFYIDDKFIGDAAVVKGTANLIYESGDAGNHVLTAIYNSINYLSSNGTAKMFVDTGDIEVEDYSSIATFKALADLIENAPEGSVLNLTKDYIYVSGSNEGISINKAITIDGKGHTVDGNQLSVIFYVDSNRVILKNLNVINGKYGEVSNSRFGGAINWKGIEGSIVNCSFVNNQGYAGGAICWYSSNGSLVNCTFERNNASMAGGAVYWISDNSNIINCNFTNNFANDECGAVIFSGVNVSFINCLFVSNYGNDDIESYTSNYLSIINCSFINPINYAFKLYGNHITINQSFFEPDLIYNYYIDGSNITFIKHNPQLVYDNISFYYNNSTNLSVMLKDDKNNTLANKEIDVDINGKHLIVNTNDEGVVYIQDDLTELTVGTWNVTISFGGTANYAPCNATATITVLPASSSLTIEDLNATVGHEVTLIATVNSALTVNEGFVTFFDGETYIGEANVNNGTASLNYIPTTGGEHIITSIFNSTNYLSSNSTAKLLVDSATLEVLVDNGTVGFNSTFVANVKGLYSTINEGNVAFYVNDEYLGMVPVVNGSASFVYMPLTANTFIVKAIFSNSANFLDDEDTAAFTVNSAGAQVTINDFNGTVGHDLTISVNVTSPNNLTINEGIVTFYDGEAYIGGANVYDGVATLTYIPTTAGNHTITAFYASENYQGVNASANLSVSKADVDLSIGYIESVYFTNPSNFAVNVNSNYNLVSEGEIKFYVNDVLIGSTGVYGGTANLDYVTNTTGSFILTAVFNETDNYLAANTTTYFDVNQMPTTLSGESIIFDEQAYKTFTTELKDNNNNGVYGQPVKIEVIKYSGESAVFDGVSDANGITIYDVGKLAGGMWYVTGIYAGDGNYIGSSFADKFIVVRMDTTTDIEEIENPKVNHSYKLKANIHDENGKLVKEGIVQFYLDGVDIGSIDLSNNQGHQSALGNDVLGAVNPMFEYELGADNDLYINYVPTKAGKHTLTAVYEGTTIYKSSNSTTTLDVSNSNTKETVITAKDVTTVYNGGKYLVINLKDVNGNDLNGVKVTVKFSNVKTVTPTVKNGQAKVSTDGLAPVKTYTATITFSGNAKYDKSTGTAKVIVKKATPKMTAKAKTFKKSVKTKKYSVVLKTNQNKVMKNVKLTLRVNKKNYVAKTNKKGVATFKITKLTKKGKFTAVVKYAGSKYYNAKTVKPKIIVK